MNRLINILAAMKCDEDLLSYDEIIAREAIRFGGDIPDDWEVLEDASMRIEMEKSNAKV